MARVVKGSPVLETSTLLDVLKAVQKGDFSVRLPHDWTGLAGKVADVLNEVVDQNQRLASELQRLSRVVGQQGRIQERASLGPVTGQWAESVVHVNALVASLVQPTIEASRVI